jgi:CRP-like cAMP-binding protein
MKQKNHYLCSECSAHCKSHFSSLNEQSIEDLAKKKSLHTFRKGEVIFHQETSCFGIHCIQSGSIKLYTVAEDGKEIINRIANPGDFIGLSSAFGFKKYVESAKVIDEASCCFIETSQIKNSLETLPMFLSQVMERLSLELSESNSRHADVVRKSVKARLASYLLKMSEVSPSQSDHQKFKHHLSREEMANYIGSAHETLIRCLSEFKELGYIHEENKSFIILNKERLIRLKGYPH